MAGSSNDGPLSSNPTNSMELESSRMLESVAGTEREDVESKGCILPTDDDIEKSFRVNQDGSMTVEMKVRLTLKEEETIHWTTTLSRSGVANEINTSCLPQPATATVEEEEDEQMCSPQSVSRDLQTPASSIDSINMERDNEIPASLSSSALSRSSEEVENTNYMSQTRVPTPTEYKQIMKQQARGYQTGVVGSFSYQEQIENGAVTEQYCLVKQSTTRPVPKPRRIGSLDNGDIKSMNMSSYKSSEVLHSEVESGCKEVSETVLHIYEQQTCQENFLANICAHEFPPYGRPATSETGQFSNSEQRRPSTASDSISIWRTETRSRTSDFTLSSLKTGATQATNKEQQFRSMTGQELPVQRKVKKGKRKAKTLNKRTWRLLTPGKRSQQKSAQENVNTATFSSAGSAMRIYGAKSKSPKKVTKRKKKQRRDGRVTTKASQSSDETTKDNPTDPQVKDNPSEMVFVEASGLNVATTKMPRGILTRQTLVHQEKNKSGDASKSKAQPGSGMKDYVQNWLMKAHVDHTASPSEAIHPSQKVTIETPPERTSVKLRVKCLENALSNPLVERKESQRVKIAPNPSTNINSESCTNTAESEEVNRLINGICHEMSTSPIKMSLQQASAYHTMSMDLLPPPPPPEELEKLTDDACRSMDVPSAGSSPLYQVSSLSSQMSDNHPLSVSPTSDKAISPSDNTMETSVQSDIPTMQRAPSIKRAPLISNVSLERKMSLRKASLSKYTLGTDDDENTAKTTGDDNMLPGHGLCATRLPAIKSHKTNGVKSSPSHCTSASPNTVTSAERMSSVSISSAETPTPSDAQLMETKTTQKQAVSPKPQKKKVQIISSPSPNRKSQTKTLSSDLSIDSSHNHKLVNTASPNMRRREQASAPSPINERRQKLSKAYLQNSPYSQSLDMASPPITSKTNKKKLSRYHSADDTSEPDNKTKTKTSLKKRSQTSQSKNSRVEREGTPKSEMTQTDADQRKTERQTKMATVNATNQPNMKPVLEQICYSIKSIRQITQSKHHSCLEKSNNPPDFSSHVASTFGSSSKALLAFLSVMTLKEGMTDRRVEELNANNVSCAEALKMIDSLREIASIEESHKLQASLSDLQQSTSKQLLQSWRGFQQLSSDKCKSGKSTPHDSRDLLTNQTENGGSIEEEVIDEIIDSLDFPEKLKEELASLSIKPKSIHKENLASRTSSDSTVVVINSIVAVEEEKANVDVRSIINTFANQPKECDSHRIPQRTGTLRQKLEEYMVNQALEGNTATLVEKDREDLNSCEQEIQTQNMERISQEMTKVNGVVNSTIAIEEELRKQMKSTVSYPENGITTDEESGVGEEGHNLSSASKDGGSCKQSLYSSDAGEHQSSDDVEAEYETGQQRSESEDFVELDVRNEIGQNNQNHDAEEEPEQYVIEENSDFEGPTNSDEEFEQNEQKIRSEEILSVTEKSMENIDEREQTPLNEDAKLKALIEEDEEMTTDNVDLRKDNGSKSYTLAKSDRFSVDEDSGNDHGSSEEQVEISIPHEQMRSSGEDLYEKMSNSDREEEHCEIPAIKEVKHLKDLTEEAKSESFSERVSILEKQVAEAQKRKSVAESPALKRISERITVQEFHIEDSTCNSPTSQSAFCTRSAPQSSLSFSYDSSGVITTEPESNRVKSIREMFLAKSATDVQEGHRHHPSPNTSTQRADTSSSVGYQSQMSVELSSCEDDSAQKSISKGFVRRAIERLYGKKDPEEKASERPPSAPKENKKEHSSIFSPLQSVKAKAMNELSYFNSTNALDTLTEATRCITFNAQVGPGDSVPIDNGRWLLRENTLIRKSVSDPEAINKTVIDTPSSEELCEDTEQNAPYSLFSTTSEPEDKTKSLSRKCTYFSLPHASDSDACQDDMGSVNGDRAAKDMKDSEDTKTQGECNGTLPGVGGITDFKMMDNKVYPSEGEVVVVQPGRGQGVVNRRLQEDDMLDVLYNFCGQNCPIL